MKRLFLLFILMLCCAGASYGQTLIANPTMVPPGYNGPLTFSGAGIDFTSSTEGFTLKLTHSTLGQHYYYPPFWFSPNFPYPPIDSIMGTLALPAAAPTGTYHVELVGYDFYGVRTTITANNLIHVTPTLNYCHFMGKLIRDADSNCVQTSGEKGVGGRLIKVTPGPYYAVTDSSGEFDAVLPVGTYTFTGPDLPYGTVVCPAGGSRSATMNTAYGTVTGIDFYYKPVPSTDVQSQLFLNPHRPGFNVNVISQIRNLSFQDATNVTGMLIKPSFMMFDSFQVAPVSVNGDTARFHLPLLPMYAKQNFIVRLAVPLVPLGTAFTYSARCNALTPDLNLANNSCNAHGFVTGGYDPNDKRVWNQAGENADGFIEPSDSVLRYMIRFQNTGNDTAFNIRVRDTLDENLDVGSLEVIGASHHFQLILNDSTGRPLEFYFPNILLVDSFRNEPMSHGFIAYSIRRKGGLAVGTGIDNGASIYFDFNAPVVTNTVRSVICPRMDGSFSLSSNGLDVLFDASTDHLANSWVWDFGDGNTATGAQVSHTYAAGGTYLVTLVQGSACGRIDTLVQSISVVGTIGMGDPGMGQFTVSPNPSEGWVNVSMEGVKGGSVGFVLYDATGRVVEAWEGRMGSGGYERRLQLPEGVKGTYFLRAQGKRWGKTVAIVVQ